MKRNLFFTALLLTSSFFLYGQSKDEQAVRQILNDISTNMKKQNLSFFENLYSSDFIFINAKGQKFNKAERIANIKSTPPPETFAFENARVRMYGDVALVNTEVNIKPKGQAVEHHLTTIVFVKNNGHWTEANAQGTQKSK